MTDVVVAQRMWQRRGTTAQWVAANPILQAGEIGVELMGAGIVSKIKIGDGVTTWTGLAYTAGGNVTTGSTPTDGDLLEFNSATNLWDATKNVRFLYFDGGNF